MFHEYFIPKIDWLYYALHEYKKIGVLRRWSDSFHQQYIIIVSKQVKNPYFQQKTL